MSNNIINMNKQYQGIVEVRRVILFLYKRFKESWYCEDNRVVIFIFSGNYEIREEEYI